MKKYFYPLGIFILMFISIYLLGKVHWEMEAATQKLPGLSLFSPLGIAVLKMSLLGFIFGVLMNWKGLETIYTCRMVKPNSMLVLALVSLVLTLVPHYFWTVWFGLSPLGLMGLINSLANREVHLLISVLSGFLWVQSLTPERDGNLFN